MHPAIVATAMKDELGEELVVGALVDRLIDDSGFELRTPAQLEMLQHYNCPLEAELDTTRLCLRKGHSDIAGLIVMYRGTATELAALKLELGRLQ